MSLETGDVIDGKYEIVRLLGEGGMGAVYEGLNNRIHRKVAIKVLHGNVASNADAVKRFEREAQAAGRIGSKHIVEVLDLGDLPDGDRYMVMEYLDGEDLTARIKGRGRLTPEEVYPIAVQVLEGLGAAHEAGIIHRDLKPDNVYLLPGAPGQTDFVKILDFGISKFNSLGGEFSMTQTGAVMGTPYYMSPEQAKGSRELDRRTDLYAVGVIMYEGLMGKVPFNGETFNELLFKIVLEEPPPLQVEQDPGAEEFAAIVRRAMAREVAERYQSAEEMKSALQAWAQTTGLAGNPTVSHLTPHGGVQATRMAGTTSAWASGDEEPAAGVPKSKGLGLKIGIAAALVAAAAAAFSLVPGEQPDAESDAAARAAQEEATEEEKARLDQERAQVAEERARLQRQKAEAEQAEAKRAAEEEERRRKQQQAEKDAQAQYAASPAPQPRAQPRPQPQPSPQPQPKKDTTTTSSGRTIRTTF